MKFWTDVKTWLINNFSLDPTATDAEVHQAVLDAAETKSGPDDVDGDDDVLMEDATEKADDKKTEATAETPEMKAMAAKIVALEAKIQTMGKKPQASTAGEKGTVATEKPKERAYMNTPLNKGVKFKKVED